VRWVVVAVVVVVVRVCGCDSHTGRHTQLMLRPTNSLGPIAVLTPSSTPHTPPPPLSSTSRRSTPRPFLDLSSTFLSLVLQIHCAWLSSWLASPYFGWQCPQTACSQMLWSWLAAQVTAVRAACTSLDQPLCSEWRTCPCRNVVMCIASAHRSSKLNFLRDPRVTMGWPKARPPLC
jgi:hypothetical protein